jgi:hypothetical protein
MGQEARAKSDRRTIRKAFDGMMTPKEAWRMGVIRDRICMHCQTARAVGHTHMLWPADDFQKDAARYRSVMATLQMYARENQGRIPYVQLKGPDKWPRNYVAMRPIYFCGACQAEVEKLAARTPSYVVVEIRTGPDEVKVYGQVARVPQIVGATS